MKSNYMTSRPLMKMSSPEMMSSRPQHEVRRPEAVVATVIPMEKGRVESKGPKK